MSNLHRVDGAIMRGLAALRNANVPLLRARLQRAGVARLMAGLAKRSLSLAGHRTSLALEPEFWRVLEAMAAARTLSLAGLVAQVDRARGERPLASACRLAALAYALGAAPSGEPQ
jgi:predicted DNA-binding ribbon-helix-helix protein